MKQDVHCQRRDWSKRGKCAKVEKRVNGLLFVVNALGVKELNLWSFGTLTNTDASKLLQKLSSCLLLQSKKKWLDDKRNHARCSYFKMKSQKYSFFCFLMAQAAILEVCQNMESIAALKLSSYPLMLHQFCNQWI